MEQTTTSHHNHFSFSTDVTISQISPPAASFLHFSLFYQYFSLLNAFTLRYFIIQKENHL